MISGGMLPPLTAWLPELESGQGDEKFLALRVGDRRLAGCMGLSDNQMSSVVKAIQNARGENCDAVVGAKMQVADPGQRTESTTVKRKLRTAFVKHYPDKVPDKCEISVDGTPIVTQFTVDMRRAVTILVTTDNVKALFELRDKPCADPSDGESPEKHSRDMAEFGYAEIKYNGARDVPCVYYNDADGRSRYHSEPVAEESHSHDGPDETARWQMACDRLHAFYVANHVPTA